MANELKNYQSQVSAYKFEIERLDKEIGNIKKQYFEARRQEMMNAMMQHNQQYMGMLPPETIPEEMDEPNFEQEPRLSDQVVANNQMIHDQIHAKEIPQQEMLAEDK
jgi:hypothetical protein